MSGKYYAGRQAFADGSLSWTNDHIVAQLLSAEYRFDPEHVAADDLYGEVGSAADLKEKTVTDGWANAAMLIFREVSGPPVAAIAFHRAGTNTQRATLIAFIDAVDGFPMVPNTGDIEVDIPAPGIFRV